MKAVERYALRLERKGYLFRAWRRGRALATVADRTEAILSSDVLCFVRLRNERRRRPFFLSYYRDRGIGRFLFVDNDSDDGTREYLATQPDCSVWTTPDSYRRSRFGIDWMNRLLRRHGKGHCCLTVDADEFLVYPFADRGPYPRPATGSTPLRSRASGPWSSTCIPVVRSPRIPAPRDRILSRSPAGSTPATT